MQGRAAHEMALEHFAAEWNPVVQKRMAQQNHCDFKRCSQKPFCPFHGSYGSDAMTARYSAGTPRKPEGGDYE
jgi:hypothetical protein